MPGHQTTSHSRNRPAPWFAGRRAVIVLAAAVAAVTSAWAGPRFVCDQPVFEFGTADNSQAVEHEFVVRNDGDADLEITDLRTTCGCTVAHLDEPVLAPGQTRSIRATLSLVGTNGPQLKSVIFHTNDPENAIVRLSFVGVSGVSYDLKPENATFGEVSGTRAAALSIEVVSRVDAPILDARMETVGSSFAVAWRHPTLGGRHKATVTVHTVPPLAPGTYRDQLLIRFGPPANFTLPVRVTARVPDAIGILPSTLSLPEGRTVDERYILLLQGTVKGFTVTRVILPEGIDRADIDALPSGDWRIRLSGLHGDTKLDGKTVSIVTDNAAHPTLTVPIAIVPAALDSPTP